MGDTADRDLPGYAVETVEAWVAERVDGFVGPFEWTKLEGGHSNLTYRIDSASGDLSAVIRRPPEGELLPKAHDMSREWACIAALNNTPVPVAAPLAFCEDPTVTGAHFYVMGLVDGRALYSIEDVDDWVPVERRPLMAESWIDTLAALHSLDIDEIGLGELGRREDYVARQLKTWYRSWTASAEAAAIDTPMIHDLHAELLATVPDQTRSTLVHGDYGTHNVMVGQDSTIAAVVDWEIATLGDPLADFAYSVNAWVQPDDPGLTKFDSVALSPGFPDRNAIVARYAEQTGADLSRLNYYVAFNRFKTACIMHGVYARYRMGQKAIEADELADVETRTHGAIHAAGVAAEAL